MTTSTAGDGTGDGKTESHMVHDTISNYGNRGLGLRFWRRNDGKQRLGSESHTMSATSGGAEDEEEGNGSLANADSTEYRTYKRRWLGLVQLTLMNIVVSWSWLTYAPVASQSATYYRVSESAINWLSIAFFLAFVVIFPLTIAVLHRSLKLSMSIAAVLLLLGNWIRYAGATSRASGSYGHAMAGEIVVGFAQPFVLAAPTRYSDLWFTNRGRIGATALMSLANPLGGALGQLINPLWVSEPGDISRMVLYVSIISTVAAVPAFFVPACPPTPVGPSSETAKLSLRRSVGPLLKSLELWIIMIAFSVYVGFFNSLSSLLSQIMTPYGFTNDEAGIGGAILIVVGLVTAAVVSPILDRTKKFLLAIRILVPMIATCYLIFVWMPETKTIAGPYVILAVLGGTSFTLLPVALEYLIELSHPLSPEVTSTTAWAGGQLFGAIFLIISDALVSGKDASPPKNMKNALIFEAVVALVIAIFPLTLGLFGRKDKMTLRRIASDGRGSDETGRS